MTGDPPFTRDWPKSDRNRPGQKYMDRSRPKSRLARGFRPANGPQGHALVCSESVPCHLLTSHFHFTRPLQNVVLKGTPALLLKPLLPEEVQQETIFQSSSIYTAY